MKNTKLILFLIFILALLLRIGFIIFYDNGKMLLEEYYAADEYSFNQIATNFINGRGFVTNEGLYARRGPVYPLFLISIYLIFGYSLVLVRFIQAIIGALSCIVTYFIAKEISHKEIGIISALISAIYYPFIQQPAYLLSEVIFTFLLLSSVYFFLNYYNKRDDKILFIASILWGIASLCRGIALPFTAFLLFWLGLLFKFNVKPMLKQVAILLAGIFIVIIPWSIRNFKIYKAVIPVATEVGHSLYFGNSPGATGGTGGWAVHGKDQFFPEGINAPFTQQADKTMFRLALKYMISHPKRTVILGIKKLVNMWRPFYTDARLINKIIMSISYIPIMLLAILGLIATVSRNYNEYSLLYYLIFYFIIVHMITISTIRYRYPIMPFLIVFCAYALTGIKNKIPRKI